MKFVLRLTVTTGLLFCVLSPEQVSAQLFRLWQDDLPRSNYSVLPGADPYAKRMPDYGVENVSEEIRNEVNGRTPVRPAPDFWSNAPLAQVAKQYRSPVSYTTLRPTGEEDRIQSPRFKHTQPLAPGPYWIMPPTEPSDVTSDPGDIAPLLKELMQQSGSQ